MKAEGGSIGFAAPIPREGTLVVGLAGTMLDPGVVFSQLEASRDGQLVAADWMGAVDADGISGVAAKLAHALEAAREGPVVLLGHSSGGVIALLLAIRFPQLVSGVLLANTGANTYGHGDPDAPKRIAAGLTQEVVDRFLDRCFATPPGHGDMRRLSAYALACQTGSVVAAMVSQRALDLAESLAQVRCPVIIVHGTQDKVRTRPHIDLLLAGIPGSTLVQADCGHTPPYERPVVVDRALRALLGRIHLGGSGANAIA